MSTLSAGAQAASDVDLAIRNVRALVPGEGVVDADLAMSGEWIVDCSTAGTTGASTLEGNGLLALPGVVDLHGDAFERLLMPRSGVKFPVGVALAEVDRQLLANGITTAYHGITYSWEPGLRGRDTVVSVLEALEAIGTCLGCDTRVHLRHELHNVDAEAEIQHWIRQGRIGLLALNDHLAMIEDRLDRAEKLSEYTERSGLNPSEYRALVERMGQRSSEVPAVTERLCQAAVEAGLPIASHDDETPAMRTRYRGMGAHLCEFPCNAETAREAMESGESVILGAPNILRGGSHDDRLNAGQAVREGLCTALASDYYYPAALHAAFQLHCEEVLDFPAAWDLVSGGGARAAGLSDRGQIAPGQRADVLLVDPDSALGPQVVATIAGGQLVNYHDAAGCLRAHDVA